MLVLKGTGGRVRDLAFSADSRLLASVAGRGRLITLWDFTGGKKQRLRGHAAPVRRLVFAPNGDRLASADHYGFARQWDLATGENLGSVIESDPNGPYLGVCSLAFAPDGRVLALGLAGWEIVLCDITSRKELGRLSRPGRGRTTCLGFASDGRLAASAHDGRVSLLHLSKSREVITLKQRLKVINHLAFSPDGRLLAVALGWTAALWDVARAEELRPLQGKHAGTVWSVAFTPDGQSLMTGSGDGTVKLWDVATGRERGAFAWGIGKVHVVAFAPDGMRAAAGGDGDIVIWDVDG